MFLDFKIEDSPSHWSLLKTWALIVLHNNVKLHKSKKNKKQKKETLILWVNGVTRYPIFVLEQSKKMKKHDMRINLSYAEFISAIAAIENDIYCGFRGNSRLICNQFP